MAVLSHPLLVSLQSPILHHYYHHHFWHHLKPYVSTLRLRDQCSKKVSCCQEVHIIVLSCSLIIIITNIIIIIIITRQPPHDSKVSLIVLTTLTQLITISSQLSRATHHFSCQVGVADCLTIWLWGGCRDRLDVP